ncbi:phage minor head protein [Rhodobacter capsulatus]|uniref:phage minor head protein n=1 Tax=Rhodobacter capsulatus TaxID=1061 RepID=UPI00402A1AA8
MAEVGASFGKPFDLQLAALRLRLANQVGTAAWDDLVKAQHDRAFVVAGAMKADLLADLATAVEKSIAQGTTLEEFRRDFRGLVAKHGWHGWTGEGSAKGEAWRTKVIYRTNMATSYAAGRWAQLMSMPYLIYHHGNAREPRLEHLAWDGLVLPRDHAFWQTHAPVNDWGCTCYLSGARSLEAARRRGGDPDKALPAGWDAIDPRTGAPKGIGKGWDYAPGASVSDLVPQMEQKAAKMPEPLAQDFREHLAKLPLSSGGAAMVYRTMEPTSDTEAISARAKEARMAIKTGHDGVSPEGYFGMTRAGIEAVERFALPPLRYFGVTESYPYAIRGNVPKHLALFHEPMRSITFPAATTELLTIADTPSADRVTGWAGRLGAVSAEVRALSSGTYPGWSVYKNPADIAAHEFGHYTHAHYQSEIDALIERHRMFDDGWAYLLSDYATTDRFEFFAEAFTLYLRYTSGHSRLHPALLDYFRRRDRSLK